jgi:hypothetical protein
MWRLVSGRSLRFCLFGIGRPWSPGKCGLSHTAATPNGKNRAGRSRSAGANWFSKISSSPAFALSRSSILESVFAYLFRRSLSQESHTRPSTYESLVENVPGIGSVEPAPAGCRKNVGRHQSSVHAHTIRRLSHRCPMRHAAAVTTTVELNGFVAPTIAIGRYVIRDDVYVCGRIVGPQNTITPTDGAIAFCDFYRRELDL